MYLLPSVSPQWNHCSLAVAVGFNLQLFFVVFSFFFFLILRTSFILTPQRCEEQPDVPLSLLLLSRFNHVRLLWPYELQPARLLCPWDSPGKRTLEWVAISFSRGSSPPRDQTQVSCIAGRFFTAEPSGKPFLNLPLSLSFLCPPPNLLLGYQY